MVREMARGRFQFLIGSLKTDAGIPGPRPGREFQFLIGSLKTRLGSSEARRPRQVSIPHRQSKNLAVPFSLRAARRGFNSS